MSRLRPRGAGRLLAAAAALAALAAASLLVAGRGDDVGAATVVTNAEVYTLDRDRPWAEAFAYDSDGVIVAVGDEAEVLDAAGGDAEVADARGSMVLPGFQDPHVHVPEAGINEGLCLLPARQALSAYEKLAAACARSQPGNGWVRAAGPSLFELREADELPIDVLDRAIPDRPALILDDLGHAVWTNSLGLEAAGIGLSDPDPKGGVFHRHPETGELTGLLLENAQHRVRDVAAAAADTNYKGLRVALEELARNGVTTISDAGGFWAQRHPEAWLRAEREGTLTVRALNALYLYPDRPMDEQLDEFARRYGNDPDRLLRFNTAKVYVDGILDLGTAALVEPYDDPVDPDLPSGFLYFRQDDLQAYATKLHEIGYQLNFHAIGDAATRAALDAVEAIDAADRAERRHRITHTYLVHPQDRSRFAELGVIADFQVGPDSTGREYHEFLSDSIGKRAFDLIPTATLLEAGARVSLSSDWDADPLSPLGTIERALTRATNAVPDLETAISLVTQDAAYALGHDEVTGSLEVGKLADYVVLDRQLFDVDAAEISETKVLATVLAGKEVYRAKRFPR